MSNLITTPVKNLHTDTIYTPMGPENIMTGELDGLVFYRSKPVTSKVNLSNDLRNFVYSAISLLSSNNHSVCNNIPDIEHAVLDWLRNKYGTNIGKLICI